MNIFENKIIKYGEKPANQFQANPLNFRKHPEKQRAAVRSSLSEIGWISTVIENKQTGNLIDGHERVWAALQQDESTLVPYLLVDLTPKEEKLALAVYDQITSMAEIDSNILEQILQEVEAEEEALNNALKEMADEANIDFGNGKDEVYTRSVEAPIYEPKGEKPSITDLYSDENSNKLIEEIELSDIGLEEKEFLISAAKRHTIFNYKKIADYYAHSSPDVQRLMENSALIIIDFDRAIELGYVKLSERVAKQYGKEHG